MSEPNDDGQQVEEECQFVGGPYDGRTFSVPRSQNEYALPVEAAALFEQLQDMVDELSALAASLEALRGGGEVAGEPDSDPDEEEEAYAQPAPGGVLYRRIDDGRTFHFIGHISENELEERQRES